MAVFRRDKADHRSPLEVGIGHIQLCGQLCTGVNAASSDLNKPLPAAADALPVASLLGWDDDTQVTQACTDLLFGWEDSGIGRASLYQRYLFAHSIFQASYDGGARGQLPKFAVRVAATELEGLSMTAIQEGDSEFALLTGSEQLEQFGRMLGDYQVLAAASATSLLAQLSNQPSDSFRREMSDALAGLTLDKLEDRIARAENQKSHSPHALLVIDRYKRIAVAAANRS